MFLFFNGETAYNFCPIMFLPFLRMAKEKGLLYSTLQQDAETCPSFGFGKEALPSKTR